MKSPISGRWVLVTLKHNKNAESFVQAIHKQHLTMRQLKVMQHEIQFYIERKHIHKIKKLRRKYQVKIHFQMLDGQQLLLKDIYTFVGILFFLIIPIVLNSFLWEINIVNATPETEDLINEALQKDMHIEKGLLMKRLPSETDIRQVILAKYPDLSWLFISKIGSKLQLQVKYAPKNEVQHTETATGNLVARTSGVITHTNITSGERLVTENMTVYQGDLLVSGIVRFDKKEYLVGAAGEVYADYWLNTEFTMPASIEFEVVKDRAWKVQGFTLPDLLKEYRQTISDVIDVEEVVLLEKKKVILTEENAEKYILPILYEKVLQNLPKKTTIKQEKLLHLSIDNDTVKGNVLFLINENIATLQPFEKGD